MTPTATGVLKKDCVKPSAPCRIGQGSAPAAGAAAGAAQVRVVQQQGDRAVLEVRCRCGQATYVECQWPAANGMAKSQ